MSLFQKRATKSTSASALVVDDSRSARYAMRTLLEKRRYSVATAESAQDAYVYLSHRQPDVIFLDHQMPGHDGLDMLAELRQKPQTAAVPIIICSADDDESFIRRAREGGAFDVLAKPPNADQLDTLLNALSSHVSVTGDGTSPLRRGPTVALYTAAPAARAPESVAARISALEGEIAELRKALSAASANTPEALLPELKQALEHWVRQHTHAAARDTLAELFADLAGELRDKTRDKPRD